MKRILLFLLVPFLFICSSAKVMAANANLTNLTISAGSGLSPGFAAGTYNYTANVSPTTTSVTVKPTGTLVAITVNGTTVASGSNSGAIALSPGANTITIVVTRALFTPSTYTITVNREDISYTGSPFVFYTGGTISTLSSTELGSNPTNYSGTLPAGLSVANSGDITGTPTATSAATNYTITANYGGGVTAATVVNMQVLASSISYSGTPFTFNAGTAIATAPVT